MSKGRVVTVLGVVAAGVLLTAGPASATEICTDGHNDGSTCASATASTGLPYYPVVTVGASAGWWRDGKTFPTCATATVAAYDPSHVGYTYYTCPIDG